MYSTDSLTEKLILVGLEETCYLDELQELVRTSGGEVVGRLTQNRDAMHPDFYLGKGKLDELQSLVDLTKATGIVCDDELSSRQMKKMNSVLNVKVLDRTMIILDIFARRASSAEGKVQVELAQLRYRQTHLIDDEKQLSRLGGGIGTRGPGESKLETDRRHIRSRISFLTHELKEIKTQRAVQREKRIKSGLPVVSLVGYTNAGKSTLMNTVTNAGVYEDNLLFATLDTTTRKETLPSGRDYLLSDTVGFIQKLPHGLIVAFRATLEEVVYADLLVHVVDSSNPDYQQQMKTVYETLSELECNHKPCITVYNKMDIRPQVILPKDTEALATLSISAKTGEGVEDLLNNIEEAINGLEVRVRLRIPYAESRIKSELHGRCKIIAENFEEDGIYLDISASNAIVEKYSRFVAVDGEN